MRSSNGACRSLSLFSVALVASLALLACGGEGPTSASGADIVLRGTVVNPSAATGVRAANASASAAGITVTVVENRAITTTVGADGSFTLRGLPEGGFTLEFSMNGTVIGTLRFDEVKPNQEITITVQVTTTSVVLVEQKRNGIGHGDLEIEGLVQEVISRSTTGDSRFRIDGRVVVARPGQTAIREGNTSRTVNDLAVGVRVHVKGVWMTGTTSSQQEVLAHEIKIQRDDDEDDDDNRSQSCLISGGRVGDRIELEGNVQSGDASSFMLKVQGGRAGGPVQVEAGGATFQCTPANGPNAPTPEQCRAKVTGGAKVHVSGTLASCDTTSASVRASRIIVQK
jgi:hypothetical protein